VDEHRFVLDILLQRHRDTETAKTFFPWLLVEDDVLKIIDTDQLRSYGAAIREIPSLADVDHQQVIFTRRCNNMIEQSHCPTRGQDKRVGVVSRVRSAQEISRYSSGGNAHQTWSSVAAGAV